MTVALSLVHSTLRIEVADFGNINPDQRNCYADATDDEHGRGIGIVNLLADRAEILQEQKGWRVRATIGIAVHPS
ncbi:hypothetical protein SAMN05414137_12318 [Streptacidiphilus jiangxiensis]|uniref:Histidine kinase/HSP90-like ATPase domain-containing protein n=2 Tax=Streptacidiphilus jiangxiensis TaxID=235985 RepID=A0A1H7X7S0_STRJI|nr:hypothetical protein SAMN05414137_12318 [Streptacidiphilus jiangxiensis]